MAATDDPLGDCLAALKTAWSAAASLNGIGGPHLSTRPAGPAGAPAPPLGPFPYATVETEPSVLDRWTCDNEYWDNGITFWIHESTAELVLASVNLVRAVFVPETLSLPLANGGVVRKRIEQSRFEQLDEYVHRGSVPISLYTRRPRVKS